MNEIKQKTKEYMPELLKNLEELVSYPSVYAEDAKPFGQANINCLNHALDLGRKLGFKAVNVDNYAGYIEIGQGEEVIGIVGHLDVVPASDSWKTDPFKMTKIGDKYYGRGTSDDKGGVVCGLMAMKILKDIKPDLNKRIRLIMGCNEESGSACLRYYIQKEGHVDCGFTPDGSFPVIFGEKGMISAEFSAKSSKILEISGGSAANAVAARMKLTVPANSFDMAVFQSVLGGYGLTSTYEQTDVLKIEIQGKAAHASTPEEGINAISLAMEALYEAGFDDEFVKAFHQYVCPDYYGAGLGVDSSDDYGRLTSNIGIISKKEETIQVTIDIRFPVTMTNEPIVKKLVEHGNGHISCKRAVDPLFFSLDHPMITALLDAYYEVTGSSLKPLTMGGGTYARTMDNIVAFGCDTQEHNWRIHDDDEFVTEKSLETQVEVYTKALINLLEI